jgi:predicted ATPase
LTFNDGTRVSLPSGTGALALASESGDHVPTDVRRIRSYLENVRHLGAALSRPAEFMRQDVILTGRSSVLWTARGLDPRLVSLGATLALWFEKFPDRYAHVVTLLKQLGGHGALRVQIHEDTSARQVDVGPQQQASISFDGVDFGRLPDALLRRLELIVALVDPTPTTLFIEEPETIAVPGMIGRLLETIDGYAPRRQVVLATQASHVVNWAAPNELRIVEGARDRANSVRGLDDIEMSQATTHVESGGEVASLFGLA